MFGYFTKPIPSPVLADFVVDDQPDSAAAYGGYAIPPFGRASDHEQLWKLVEKLRSGAD